MSAKKTAPAKGKTDSKPTKTAATTKKAPPMKAGKSDDKSKKIEAKAADAKAAPSEDDEDEEMDRPSSGGGAAGAMATLAAASAPTEVSHSFKNFRHHPDMENFYRFIFDNDLRFEALAIIDEVLGHKKIRKKLATQKSRAH